MVEGIAASKTWGPETFLGKISGSASPLLSTRDFVVSTTVSPISKVRRQSPREEVCGGAQIQAKGSVVPGPGPLTSLLHLCLHVEGGKVLPREETAQARPRGLNRHGFSKRVQLSLWVRRAASEARLRRAVSPADVWPPRDVC